MLILSSAAREWEVVVAGWSNAGYLFTTVSPAIDITGATLLVIMFTVSTAHVFDVARSDNYGNVWSPAFGDDPTGGGSPWVGISFVSQPITGNAWAPVISWALSDYNFAIPLNAVALRHPRNPRMVLGSVQSITSTSMTNFSLPRNGIMLAGYGAYRGLSHVTSIDDPVGNTRVLNNPSTSGFNAGMSTFIYGPGKATGPLTVGNASPPALPNSNATIITLVPA